MLTWPFVTTEATLAEAIIFIAKLTRGESESVDASNRRVRDHIRKAGGRKRKPRFDAPRDSSARIGEAFWVWARGEWPALNTVTDFPFVNINRCVGIANLGPIQCFGYAYGTPNDPEILREEYHKAHRRIGELEEQNRSLAYTNGKITERLQSVEAQLDVYAQREAQFKAAASESGKLGKGVPHRRR